MHTYNTYIYDRLEFGGSPTGTLTVGSFALRGGGRLTGLQGGRVENISGGWRFGRTISAFGGPVHGPLHFEQSLDALSLRFDVISSIQTLPLHSPGIIWNMSTTREQHGLKHARQPPPRLQAEREELKRL